MSKLFCSDLHISHRNICKFTDRKLVTTQEDHDQWLIEIWNKQVTNSDLVYILGDVSFGKFDYTQEVLSQMKGQKIVIKGNHDNEQNLIKLTKSDTIVAWKMYDEIEILDTKTCLFHFAISSWHRQHYGSWHLFGHSHGAFNPPGKCLDVGIDSSYNYFGEHRLFTEQDVVDIMQTKELYIAEQHRNREREVTYA
jgi:calcineurin-like phosphoesterase family protein